MTRPPDVFPPRPSSLRGRRRELATLVAGVRGGHPTRIALVGAGGSGKSTLACALGHRVSRDFPGGIHWFRVGAWDAHTLLEMLALRFRTPRQRLLPALRRELGARGDSFVVLDNHEDDAAVATLLDELRDAPVTWLVTARRCLLAGVSIFPVIAPLVTSGRSAFPRVASLTRLLRWNPLALDLADALVADGVARVSELEHFLRSRGVDRVRVIEHEDDLPEVGLLVELAWKRLSPAPRRMLGVLAHTEGDHVDRESLFKLARARAGAAEALDTLCRWHLVQEPFVGRFALHATVQHAVARRTRADPRRHFEHYVALIEQHPERLDLEQTHLFSALDYAHSAGNLAAALRLDDLLTGLDM